MSEIAPKKYIKFIILAIISFHLLLNLFWIVYFYFLQYKMIFC